MVGEEAVLVEWEWVVVTVDSDVGDVGADIVVSEDMGEEDDTFIVIRTTLLTQVGIHTIMIVIGIPVQIGVYIVIV